MSPSAKAVTTLKVTVYKGGRRRYFSKAAAYVGASRAMMKARCDCTPVYDWSPEDGETDRCKYCDPRGCDGAVLQARLARWLRWRDEAVSDA